MTKFRYVYAPKSTEAFNLEHIRAVKREKDWTTITFSNGDTTRVQGFRIEEDEPPVISANPGFMLLTFHFDLAKWDLVNPDEVDLVAAISRTPVLAWRPTRWRAEPVVIAEDWDLSTANGAAAILCPDGVVVDPEPNFDLINYECPAEYKLNWASVEDWCEDAVRPAWKAWRNSTALEEERRRLAEAEAQCLAPEQQHAANCTDRLPASECADLGGASVVFLHRLAEQPKA